MKKATDKSSCVCVLSVKMNGVVKEVAIGHPQGSRSGSDNSVPAYSNSHFKQNENNPAAALAHAMQMDLNLDQRKKKRIRSAATPASNSKKCTESIYTRDVLCILSEANQNAQKINSKFRYHLDHSTHSAYDIYIRVFDVNKNTWLQKPWTMKKFLGKHAYLKERVKAKREDRSGGLSARSSAYSERPDFKTSFEAMCGWGGKSSYASEKAEAQKSGEGRTSRDDECSAGKHERCRNFEGAAFCTRIDSAKALKSARNPKPRLYRPSNPRRQGEMLTELEQIEQLCRRVSKQVRLAKAIF